MNSNYYHGLTKTFNKLGIMSANIGISWAIYWAGFASKLWKVGSDTFCNDTPFKQKYGEQIWAPRYFLTQKLSHEEKDYFKDF